MNPAVTNKLRISIALAAGLALGATTIAHAHGAGGHGGGAYGGGGGHGGGFSGGGGSGAAATASMTTTAETRKHQQSNQIPARVHQRPRRFHFD